MTWTGPRYLVLAWTGPGPGPTLLNLGPDRDRDRPQKSWTDLSVLFTTCLRDVIRSLNWDNKGINVNGRFLSHLIFADDIVIFSHSLKQLQRRIDELVTASSTVELKVNVKKTKTMTNFPGTASLSISGEPIEEVNEKYKHFLMAPAIAMKLKRRLFNMVIVPTMLYGAETWALTKQAETRLATTQRRMERRMIGVRLLDHCPNEWLRGVTKVVDIVKAA
uniref:Reverse transcriptase domain-containing protein n=1 Tax=Plectus sambesii TaxID=2011161 RepID=A0A914XTB0_9BILA